jgi:hypothetical protein
MIPKDNEFKLIYIYLYICDLYDKQLHFYCQRFSNNKNPAFTDQEILTIYLYAMSIEQFTEIKRIHKFANEYLRSWFPHLPSYEAFNMRINRLNEPFRLLTNSLLGNFQPDDCILNNSLLDSLPIMTCSGKRKGKVASDITDKGYCSTKGVYYYGMKLHALSFRRKNQLPFPEEFQLTVASENDLNLFKQAWGQIPNRIFFGDKIYYDKEYFQNMYEKFNSLMLTPVKAIKNQAECLKQMDKAYNDLFSKAVSTVRQPIEGLFSWLIRKTDIQRAFKVRSTKGLLVFIFGRLAAAFIYLIFNS